MSPRVLRLSSGQAKVERYFRSLISVFENKNVSTALDKTKLLPYAIRLSFIIAKVKGYWVMDYVSTTVHIIKGKLVSFDSNYGKKFQLALMILKKITA